VFDGETGPQPAEDDMQLGMGCFCCLALAAVKYCRACGSLRCRGQADGMVLTSRADVQLTLRAAAELVGQEQRAPSWWRSLG
jgi:hypothetical protein